MTKQSPVFKTLGISEEELLTYLKDHPDDPLVTKLEQLLVDLSDEEIK